MRIDWTFFKCYNRHKENCKLNFKTCSRLAPAVLFLAALLPIHASEMAEATITSTQLNTTTWQYDLTLDDVGTTNIGTFWFSWIPGEDFMPVSPTDVAPPTGWTDNITNGGASDGFAIQWLAGSTAAATPNEKLTFQFDSTASPASIEGNSPFYPGTPVLTSFIYSGAPFSDAGDEFVVQPAQSASTPEPSSLLLAAAGVGILALCSALRRGRSARNSS